MNNSFLNYRWPVRWLLGNCHFTYNNHTVIHFWELYKVLLSNGSYGIIDSVVIDDLEHEEFTYNFEVEDYHTYFVGDSEVCVHNVECGDPNAIKEGATNRVE